MKKAILALTICAVVGGFSVTGNAAQISDAQAVRDYIVHAQNDGTSNPDVLKHWASLTSGQQAQVMRTQSISNGKMYVSHNAQTAGQLSAAAGQAAAANKAAQVAAQNTPAIVAQHTATAIVAGKKQAAAAAAQAAAQGQTTGQAAQNARAYNVTPTAYRQSVSAAQNANAQAQTNQTVSTLASTTATDSQRIDMLETSTNQKFANLTKKVDENRQRASAGIAGVAAMANIPQVTQGQTFAVGAGVGTTDGESALALGLSARATDHVVVKASVSDDSQQNFVVGAGASYGW